MALASGANFAGYPVARRLGSGVTGEVYLVQDPRAARWLALKVLSPDLSADGDFRRRFLAETTVAANLYHPHIVEVYARGEFDGRLWVAMDYVEGNSAARLMADRFPAVAPAGEVLAIVTAVAGALDHAHERGMLHRDVKPGNILLTSGPGEQRILLADFGIARQPGTVGYAAPEAVLGADVDGRADQYALAATAFHLLTGAPPAEHDAAPRLSDQRPELARMDGVFVKALSRRPGDRFDSCRRFADAAAEAAGLPVGERGPGATEAVEADPVVDYPAYAWMPDLPPTRSAPRPAPDAAPATLPAKRRPRKVLVGAAAVALVAGLLALGFVIGRKTDNTAPAASPPSSASAPAAAPPAPSTPSGPPAPLDGTYRLEVQRARQTFNYTPNPQPPNVNTWWAFRSSCTPSYCAAAAIQLDNNEHTQPNAAGVRPVVMRFTDGEWRSEPETAQFPCVAKDGAAHTQTMTQVLTLRPGSQRDLVGEMNITVQSNECGQQSAVVRVPTVATRTGDTAPGVYVPDPATIGGAPSASGPPTTTGAPTATAAPTPSATAPSGPGR
ncbi:serine/threonine-protein kinase [Mycobacterium sp. 663a-19]|uniref:serine/threonine-protein kinase n=1 Tax=Mycobacterium sp. 663a-19 TaxID=2986148 RepID=UPI002D1F3D6C|nr:serine/threonine-protein kinase [Mycobacterium sp. 663a-19]MEB3983938.1 serine/threonine-protein kinase [Mycobacterium sp. 663a-19]